MDSDELKQNLGLLAHIKQCCLVTLTLARFAVFNSIYGTQICPHSNRWEFRESNSQVIRDLGERAVSGLDSLARQWLLGRGPNNHMQLSEGTALLLSLISRFISN